MHFFFRTQLFPTHVVVLLNFYLLFIAFSSGAQRPGAARQGPGGGNGNLFGMPDFTLFDVTLKPQQYLIAILICMFGGSIGLAFVLIAFFLYRYYMKSVRGAPVRGGGIRGALDGFLDSIFGGGGGGPPPPAGGGGQVLCVGFCSCCLFFSALVCVVESTKPNALRVFAVPFLLLYHWQCIKLLRTVAVVLWHVPCPLLMSTFLYFASLSRVTCVQPFFLSSRVLTMFLLLVYL